MGVFEGLIFDFVAKHEHLTKRWQLQDGGGGLSGGGIGKKKVWQLQKGNLYDIKSEIDKEGAKKQEKVRSIDHFFHKISHR